MYLIFNLKIKIVCFNYASVYFISLEIYNSWQALSAVIRLKFAKLQNLANSVAQIYGSRELRLVCPIYPIPSTLLLSLFSHFYGIKGYKGWMAAGLKGGN